MKLPEVRQDIVFNSLNREEKDEIIKIFKENSLPIYGIPGKGGFPYLCWDTKLVGYTGGYNENKILCSSITEFLAYFGIDYNLNFSLWI